jgi:hypothetical protein
MGASRSALLVEIYVQGVESNEIILMWPKYISS